MYTPVTFIMGALTFQVSVHWPSSPRGQVPDRRQPLLSSSRNDTNDPIHRKSTKPSYPHLPVTHKPPPKLQLALLLSPGAVPSVALSGSLLSFGAVSESSAFHPFKCCCCVPPSKEPLNLMK